MVSPVSLQSSVMEGHRILRSIQDFRNLPKTSDSSGSWRIQAATVCRVTADQRPWRQSAGKWKDSRESFLLPVGASQSGRRNALPRCGPVSSEQREPCAFLACAASLNGAMEKAGKARSEQPVSRTRKGITDRGIFVNLAISTSATQDEWTSVYEESLRGNKRSSDPRKTGSKRPESASRAGSLPRDPLTQWGRK